MNRWIRSLPSLLGRLARPTANLRLLQEAAPGVAARPLLHGALLSGAVVGALAANGARFCSSPIQMDSGKASRPKQVFIRNGQVFECDFGKSELLKRYLGAYTTARTVDRTSLFAFSQHVTRLINTAQAVWLKEGHSGSEKLQSAEVAQTSLEKLGPEGLKALLRSEICAALAELQHLSKEEASEFQVTIMMTLDTVGPHTPAGRGFDVYTFAQPMPPMPQEVKVMAVCAERDHPTIKDAEWVKVRQGLERWQEEQGANEVVMFDEHGNFTEGLQTNFFAVSGDGVVLTAPDDRVLSGSIRKVVIDVCRKNNIPIRFECPTLENMPTWEGCFICSTSRLVKPIFEWEVPNRKFARKFSRDPTKTTFRLEKLVEEAFRSDSEPLY